MVHKPALVVTIDGPAASGKGMVAEHIAKHYRLAYLDTGLLYRALAWLVLHQGGDPHDQDSSAKLARSLFIKDGVLKAAGGLEIKTDSLRAPHIGQGASLIAAFVPVRSALLRLQQRFAKNPDGAVLDGRDTGTVIAPFAPVKLFVTASAEVRAQRRWRQYQISDQPLDRNISLEEVLNDIKDRDRRDQDRAIAPLKMPENAILLDSTDLSIEETLATALNAVALAYDQKD